MKLTISVLGSAAVLAALLTACSANPPAAGANAGPRVNAADPSATMQSFRPASNAKADLSTPESAVKEFYRLTASGDYASAWSLIHPGEQNHPSQQVREQLKKDFLALQGKKGPALVKAEKTAPLDEYKFYITGVMQANVPAVNVELSDGTRKTVHPFADDKGQYRLFWDQANGLE